jgi:hypothetical protein
MTSKPVASKAGKVLGALRSAAIYKTIAASDLAQAKRTYQPGALARAAAAARPTSSFDWAASILDPVADTLSERIGPRYRPQR